MVSGNTLAGNGATDDPGAVPWLNDTEQHLWRAMLKCHRTVERLIEVHLLETIGISSADFSVLVTLSEAPGYTCRMRELCESLEWDRSRMSHQITRMVKRELVVKKRTLSDSRGIDVALTDKGLGMIQNASPEHVRLVRSVVFDTLQEGEGGMAADDIAAATKRYEEVMQVAQEALDSFR